MSVYIIPYGGITRILDVGAGDKILMKYLHGYTQYIPVGRGDCDLNKNPEDLMQVGRVHYAFCSGILEYMEDVPRLLKILGIMADNIILSYNGSSTRVQVPHDEMIERRGQGWVNDYTIDEIVEMVKSQYYQIDSIVSFHDRPKELIVVGSHPGVWRKADAPGCTARVPVDEWRFRYDAETWARYATFDPGSPYYTGEKRKGL